MEDAYHVEQVAEPDGSVWSAVGGGVRDHNIDRAGPEGGRSVCFVLRDAEQAILGGVIGETHWGWLYVNLLWVAPELRGRGYGSRLLAMAEAEASAQGASHAYLDTFTFQAPGFYAAHGYEVYGTLSDFPTGHERWYMRKELTRA